MSKPDQQMKLWRKASGALKDQRSIWIATIARRSSLRNPEIEAAVIKSTNHDELFMDAENIAFVYRLLILSSDQHQAIMFAISTRMAKARSWVVALKGLILMHGIFACKVPFVQKIGGLPFDLSNFRDRHSDPGETWDHDKFIRSYYTFLDQKSAFHYHCVFDNDNHNDYEGKDNDVRSSMKQKFGVIRKLQGLLDMLLEIRPQTEATIDHPLFVEAIDCVIVEVFDVYSQICSRISKFLKRICSVGKEEAAMALKTIQKATRQGEELSLYFAICIKMGVMDASDYPRIETISKEDMKDLEDIINGGIVEKKQLNEDHHDDDTSNEENEYSKQSKMIMTITTHNWETFDEDSSAKESETLKRKNPFQYLLLPALPPPKVHNQCDDIPDLISL